MARPNVHQSSLRYPLTGILGSVGNIRVLRELFQYGQPLSAPALAKRVGITPQSTREILSTLEAKHIVSRAGSGRTVLYAADKRHPLATTLNAMFHEEEDRFDTIVEALRDAAKQAGVAATWLYGSAARGEDTDASDLDVAIVTEDRSAVERIREFLEEPQERLLFTASVVGLRIADVVRLAKGDPWWNSLCRDAMVITGFDPKSFAENLRKPSSHPKKSQAKRK